MLSGSHPQNAIRMVTTAAHGVDHVKKLGKGMPLAALPILDLSIIRYRIIILGLGALSTVLIVFIFFLLSRH